LPKSSGRGGIGGARRAVEQRQRDLPAAVGDVQQQPAVAAPGLGRAQQVEIGPRLHAAVGVARGQREVGHRLVRRVRGVGGEADDAGDLLVRPGLAERRAVQHERASLDLQSRD
jgi:hypothetical protein